jgi:hypothetical protein
MRIVPKGAFLVSTRQLEALRIHSVMGSVLVAALLLIAYVG